MSARTLVPPYAEQMAFESLNPKELKSLRRSGTIISSMLSRSVFERGLEGTESDEERIAMLVEILRVTYAPLLPKEQQEEEDSPSQYSVAMDSAAWPETDH